MSQVRYLIDESVRLAVVAALPTVEVKEPSRSCGWAGEAAKGFIGSGTCSLAVADTACETPGLALPSGGSHDPGPERRRAEQTAERAEQTAVRRGRRPEDRRLAGRPSS